VIARYAILEQDASARWLADSVNKPYRDFDFGQKKQPSAWLTLLALRAFVQGPLWNG
jgi:hypothetical protein